MRKEFRIEGTVVIPDSADNDSAVQISQAISLMRIASALEKLVAEPAKQHSSVFEETFGKSR